MSCNKTLAGLFCIFYTMVWWVMSSSYDSQFHDYKSIYDLIWYNIVSNSTIQLNPNQCNTIGTCIWKCFITFNVVNYFANIKINHEIIIIHHCLLGLFTAIASAYDYTKLHRVLLQKLLLSLFFNILFIFSWMDNKYKNFFAGHYSRFIVAKLYFTMVFNWFELMVNKGNKNKQLIPM